MKTFETSRILVACSLAVSVALLAACASEKSAAPETSPPSEAGLSDDASSAADAEVDASVAPRPKEIVQAAGDRSLGASCDSVCAARGGSLAFRCDACQASTAAVGEASYRNSATNPATKKDTTIATCAAPVSTKLTEGAASYQLWAYSCCCSAPKLEQVTAAKGAPPRSCDDVCRGKGLSCDRKNTWGDLGDAPFQLKYVCAGVEELTTTSGNDNPNTAVYGCDAVPTATFTQTSGLGRTCTLDSYECACR